MQAGIKEDSLNISPIMEKPVLLHVWQANAHISLHISTNQGSNTLPKCHLCSGSEYLPAIVQTKKFAIQSNSTSVMQMTFGHSSGVGLLELDKQK